MIIPEVEGRRNTEVSRPERRGVSTRTVIEEAKAKVSTIDLADRLCGPGRLHRVGDKWVARCPLPGHEDRSPSFVVYPGDGGWHCFGCQRGGDVVDLARLAWGYPNDGRGMAEAAAYLLLKSNHELPQRPQSWFKRQERQAAVRNAIYDARVEVLMRRLWKYIFMPILEDLEGAEEREALGDKLWIALRPHAERLLEDRTHG